MKKYFCLIAVLGLSACVTPHGGGYYGGQPSDSSRVYNSRQTQSEQIVRFGVIESVRQVTIQRDSSGVGTVAGAAVGALAGSNIGRGKGSTVGGILGAVAGGVAGNAIESNIKSGPGFEITVRLDNGEYRAITQAADEVFRVGERVRLLTANGVTRVTH
jgi:outer membrane lipoprotein SlyB